jgi:catechol 2,3-dioxygenase-like lactoylglutathione lyase family enzyme
LVVEGNLALLKLGHVELFVRDPLKSREFYENILGFEVIAVQQEQFVWLSLGTLEILLRPGTPQSAPEYRASAAGLVLYTNELEKTVEQLTGRGLIFGAQEGSEDCYTFKDPDGHWFQLVDPADHQ